MRKNLNKFIAFGIGLSVMASSVVPAMAAQVAVNTQSSQIGTTVNSSAKVLSLQNAIDAAINNDEQLKKCSLEINYYKDLQDYYDEADDDIGEDQNDVNLKDAQQSKKFRVDAVEYEITNLYNDILLTQKQKELEQIIFKNKQEETEQYRLKAKHGLITAVQLENYEQDLKKEEDTLKNFVNKEKDLRYKLTLATKIDVSNITLQDTLQFKPFRVNGDLDEYIDANINTMLQYKYELVDVLNDKVDDMEDSNLDDLDMPNKNSNKFNPVVGVDDEGNDKREFNKEAYEAACQQVLEGYKGYLEVKKTAQSTKATLNAQEKQFKYQLRSSYSTILDLENQMNQTIAKINTTNKTLAHTKLQYNLGLMTTNQYDTAVAGCLQADIGLRQLANGYYKASTAFEKPWAASGGAQQEE